MSINRKVIKTGNSLALTIPTRAVKAFDIKEGDIASIIINRSKNTMHCSFTGHPRQLSFIGKQK